MPFRCSRNLVAPARGPLHLLLIAVGLVLLVACVNVANLVLARSTGRVQEFGIRSALGSGSHRLVRQMLVESLVLAGFGGLMGLGVAAVMVRVLHVLGRDAIPRLYEVGFDPGRARICGARHSRDGHRIRRGAGAPLRFISLPSASFDGNPGLPRARAGRVAFAAASRSRSSRLP